MIRKEAWERYQEEINGTIQAYREEMGKHLSGRAKELEGIVADAVDRLREPILKQRKTPLCYVHFSSAGGFDPEGLSAVGAGHG